MDCRCGTDFYYKSFYYNSYRNMATGMYCPDCGTIKICTLDVSTVLFFFVALYIDF